MSSGPLINFGTIGAHKICVLGISMFDKFILFWDKENIIIELKEE